MSWRLNQDTFARGIVFKRMLGMAYIFMSLRGDD